MGRSLTKSAGRGALLVVLAASSLAGCSRGNSEGAISVSDAASQCAELRQEVASMLGNSSNGEEVDEMLDHAMSTYERIAIGVGIAGESDVEDAVSDCLLANQELIAGVGL